MDASTGYARNFLFPRGFATPARGAEKQIESIKQALRRHAAALLEDAQARRQADLHHPTRPGHGRRPAPPVAHGPRRPHRLRCDNAWSRFHSTSVARTQRIKTTCVYQAVVTCTRTSAANVEFASSPPHPPWSRRSTPALGEPAPHPEGADGGTGAATATTVGMPSTGLPGPAGIQPLRSGSREDRAVTSRSVYTATRWRPSGWAGCVALTVVLFGGFSA
ncbi:hypothetical protein QJS66_14215 [Kocuria rhizophila]|nr:hypothetical protein QJS66_14215 [Kocuria rhizophila]